MQVHIKLFLPNAPCVQIHINKFTQSALCVQRCMRSERKMKVIVAAVARVHLFPVSIGTHAARMLSIFGQTLCGDDCGIQHHVQL